MMAACSIPRRPAALSSHAEGPCSTTQQANTCPWLGQRPRPGQSVPASPLNATSDALRLPPGTNRLVLSVHHQWGGLGQSLPLRGDHVLVYSHIGLSPAQYQMPSAASGVARSLNLQGVSEPAYAHCGWSVGRKITKDSRDDPRLCAGGLISTTTTATEQKQQQQHHKTLPRLLS